MKERCRTTEQYRQSITSIGIIMFMLILLFLICFNVFIK